MSWLSSVVIATLTAVVGAIASGYVANLAVGWYRISSFEAGSAAFVIGLGLLGLVAGLLIGLVTSRVMASGGDPGFIRTLGTSQAILLGLVAVVGTGGRLMADVPPEIDGERLLLAVEVRWPEGHATSPAAGEGEASLRLGSVTRGSRTLRTSQPGQLWTADARLVDGRWVAPGAVPVFTARGQLVLDVVLDGQTTKGFIIPLSGRPTKQDLEWTDWYPRARPGEPPLPNGFTYRYRVRPRSAPVRTETFGPFEILTSINGFLNQQVDGGLGTVIAAEATFTVRHRGQPVVIAGSASSTDTTTNRFERFDAVSAVAGPRPALVVNIGPPVSGGACYLVREDLDRVRSDFLADCPGTGVIDALSLTADTAVFRASRRHGARRGQFDRATFGRGGLFLLGRAVIDTRSLAVRPFASAADANEVPSVPPLALSPGERSFARFGYADGSAERPALIVTDFVADSTYVVPIDRARMRYGSFERLDPAWVAHHFVWRRDGDSAERLVERDGLVPLPYRGEIVAEGETFYAYRLEPAGEALRSAVVDFLVAQFQAERVPVDPGAYEYPLRIGGRTVNVACSPGSHYVLVSMELGVSDRSLVDAIARRFDAALASGKYDALFEG
jgi:hypothetical protein